MPLRINFNYEATTAQNNLGITQGSFYKAVERLSSGLRINRAADDAAGLSISEKLRTQVRGTAQAQRNAQDAISMIQTGEGALNEVHSMLQRMRELAIQAGNDTLATSDRSAINQELSQLQTEIDQVSARTQFNGKFLLNGSLSASLNSGSTLQNGFLVDTANSTSVADINVAGAQGGQTFSLTGTSGVGGASLTLRDNTTSTAQTIVLSAPGANSSTIVNFAQFGVTFNLNSIAGSTATTVAAGFAGVSFTTNANSSAVYQIGANGTANDTLSLAYQQINISTLSLTATLASFAANLSSANMSGAGGYAQNLVTALDTAIQSVSTQRGFFGAAQNRLEHTISYLGVANENLASADSRIRNADVAAETAELTRTQILQQAAMAVLAQSNQAPQAALQLLR